MANQYCLLAMSAMSAVFQTAPHPILSSQVFPAIIITVVIIAQLVLDTRVIYRLTQICNIWIRNLLVPPLQPSLPDKFFGKNPHHQEMTPNPRKRTLRSRDHANRYNKVTVNRTCLDMQNRHDLILNFGDFCNLAQI